MGTIWVHAETNNGTVSTITLELLAKARELGDVVAVHAGGDAEQVAAELGEHGAGKVLSTGDLDGGLPGPALGSALADLAASEAPQAILFGTTYGGRDVAGRLSAKLDAPVITNIVDIVDSDGLVGIEPVFGGTTNVNTFLQIKSKIIMFLSMHHTLVTWHNMIYLMLLKVHGLQD